MKKSSYLVIIIISVICTLECCKKDNFPWPDAKFFGAIRDSIGGALVETELVNGSTISAYEQGFDNPVLQTWVIKNTGEFRNNLVYSGTYNFEFSNCNFFPYNVTGHVIKPGDNEHDFLVVPFIRIKNVSITHDAPGNKIVATFNVEAGKPTVKLSSITLYGFTDIYVGANVKFTTSTGTGQPSRTFSPAIDVDPATVYTLSIDLAANSTQYKTGRPYYFRVAALGNQSGVGTIRANFAPYVKIEL